MSLARRGFLGSAAAAAASAPRKGSGVEKTLTAAIDEIRLFNTHEHLLPEKERVSQAADFFTLVSHYTNGDLVSAGLTPEEMAALNDPKTSPQQKWRSFEPHWNNVRFTGYAQALSIAIADLYGVPEITSESLPRINRAIADANQQGLYDRILKDRARIDWCLVDAYWSRVPKPLDRPDFLLSHRFDGFVTPSSRKDVATLEQVSGVSIQSLGDLKRALEQTFVLARNAHMVAIKSALAYQRELLFEETPERDAAAAFEAMMKGDTAPPRGFRAQKQRVFRRMEDHMFHHLVHLADEHHVPFQIHTGLPAGNRGFLENMNPRLLANLFTLYPRVKFDLFHIGYPYQQELGALAKLFPNVYADFCWVHIVSPPAARKTLDEYLETVPANKILGFGGDYRYPELTYAHARMARHNVAQVLIAKVQAGLMNETSAIELGRMILRDNAVNLFDPQKNGRSQ